MSKIKGRNGYKPLPQQTPVNLKKLKYQEEDMEKLSKDKEKEKTKEKLKKIKEEIEIQNLFTIQQRKCKELDEMVELITNIYKNNKKSYTTSKGLTNDIMKLKDIVQKIEGNPDIKKAVDNLDKSIKGEKKEGKKEEEEEEDGTTTTVQTGLSTSYLMIQSAIIKYAQTIKCPKKEESLDDIINYFYNWTERNKSVYNSVLHKMILDEREFKGVYKLTKKEEKKEEKKYEANKKMFPFPQIIFPLYIIIKIILHRNLYNSSGSQSSRTRNTKDNINITEYLKPRLNDVNEKYLESIFTPFFDLYFKNKLKNKSNKKVDTSINPEKYPIKPPGKKNFKEYFERPDLITFIDNFENLLKKLIVIHKNEFKTHFDTDENKTFKNHFYESILSQQYFLIGPHFSFGGEIPQPNFPHPPSGFRTLFNVILRRRLTNVDNFKYGKKEDESRVKSQREALIERIKKLNDNTRPLRVGPLELGPKINNNNNKTNNSQTRKNSRYGQPALKQNKTQRLRAKNPNVEKRYRYPAWTEKDENNNKRFARKNNPYPPRSRKKSNNKTKKREDEKLQTLLGRNKTKGFRAKTPQGMGNVEDETAKFFANQLKKNKILKANKFGANKFGGKKKKHTKRNKKRHNKKKYTKKNK